MNMTASFAQETMPEPIWERITVEVCPVCTKRSLNVDQKHNPADRLKYTVRRECFSDGCKEMKLTDFGGGFL